MGKGLKGVSVLPCCLCSFVHGAFSLLTCVFEDTIQGRWQGCRAATGGREGSRRQGSRRAGQGSHRTAAAGLRRAAAKSQKVRTGLPKGDPHPEPRGAVPLGGPVTQTGGER
jgi:hypothetical protein